MIAEMLGLPEVDRDQIRVWSHQIARMIDFDATPDTYAKGAAMVSELRDYYKVLFEQKRQQPQEDLISQLLTFEEAGDRLTEAELFATLLMVAGHETTTNLIGNGVHLLLQHPDQRQRLKDDPSLIPTAVEEILRYEAPMQSTPRWAEEDVEIGGQTLKKGQFVMLALAAANRDPKQFANPQTFDVGRKDNRHLSFASGPYFYLGAQLARLEGQVAFEELLAALPDMELAETPSWRPAVGFRGLESLRIVNQKND